MTLTYLCTGCEKTSDFKLLRMIPYARWTLTCRKCGKYRAHVLLMPPHPSLLHLPEA